MPSLTQCSEELDSMVIRTQTRDALQVVVYGGGGGGGGGSNNKKGKGHFANFLAA